MYVLCGNLVSVTYHASKFEGGEQQIRPSAIVGEKLRFFVFTLVLTTQNTQYFIKVSLLKISVGKP